MYSLQDGSSDQIWCLVSASPSFLLCFVQSIFAFIVMMGGRHKCFSFYRAMHFSAKRGIAIACRLSVCLSVCPSVTLVNCDHIGWNSSKIISPLVSLGRSFFATSTWRVCSKGNTPKFGPKVTHPCWFERWRHSIANCGRMVTDSAAMDSLYETTIALSNGAIADPYDLPFPLKMRVPYAPNIREWPCLCNGWSQATSCWF